MGKVLELGQWQRGQAPADRCMAPWQDSLFQVLLPVWPLHRGAPAALQPLLRDPDLQQDLQDQSLGRLPRQGLRRPHSHL